jgi:raffinose/stachyose/melibiose transport system substrate-binding protein
MHIRPRRHTRLSVVITLLLATAVLAVTTAGAGRPMHRNSASVSKSGSLNLWLGGILTTSTPGTPYRKFVNDLIARFGKQNAGVKVNITLLPPNNEQLAAKVESAFAAHKVPDVMLLYSGAYTTPYQAGLLKLNKYVQSTPGFFGSLSSWDLSCSNLDCKGGKGDIIAVPMDYGGFTLFYNKKLFRQAGITRPPKTYTELLSDCDKLKAKSILPMAYGDRDGYTTDNMVLENYPSYFKRGDVQRILNKKIKFASPKLVDPLTWVAKLHQNKCVNADATTHEQIDATNLFSTGKAAMVEAYPGLIGGFEKGLGVATIGHALLPQSGHGPLTGGIAANSIDNWVIPKGAKNPDLAWAFIKVASNAQSGKQIAALVSQPPANKVAQASIKDPLVRWAGQVAAKPVIPLLDSVLANKATFFYYKHLQLAFAQKESPLEAMKKVDQAYATINP